VGHKGASVDALAHLLTRPPRENVLAPFIDAHL
jgi:hypothetical protein